jgi:superfamily I DNA and/or RNA helicase
MLFSKLERVMGPERVTGTKACGAFAGRLKYQWRMHPTIGTLISDVFYDGDVVNSIGTIDRDGIPQPNVCHKFQLADVSRAFDIKGKALVWIDVPWCQKDGDWVEIGEQQKKLNYSNPEEARVVRRFIEQLRPTVDDMDPTSIAVLSPYTQQVFQLSGELEGVEVSSHFRLVASLGAHDPGSEARWAHTVDSFQGNQAELVIVSLVRNNARPAGEGLGFVGESPRVNVMLSRAEQLLVLVGSWTFFHEQTKYASKQDKLWFWKQALDKLQGWFDSGRAVRIPSHLLKDTTGR